MLAILMTWKWPISYSVWSRQLGRSPLQADTDDVRFTIALLLLAGIREKLRFSKVPQFYQGYPIVFISTCLLAIAFMGFKGLVK